MSEPLVSIISGYYNRENYVEDSISSLINQTYENIEIIIFDDASTDNTYNKLKYFEYDKRVKIIHHKKNIGFTAGLINAINISNGQYIAIHGSGDISLPNRINKQVSFLIKNKDYCFVSSRIYKIDEKSNRNLIIAKNSGNVKSENFIYKAPVSHGAVMFTKNEYYKSGGYEKSFQWVSDMDLFIRLLKIKKGYILEEALYKQYVREDGASFNSKKSIVQAKFYALKVMLANSPERRDKLINKLNSEGIDSIIDQDNKDYQYVLYKKSINLLRISRFIDYKEIKNTLILHRIPKRNKIYLKIHELIYFSLKKLYLKNNSIILFFNYLSNIESSGSKLLKKISTFKN